MRSFLFISYRREDSAAYAGRICDHLRGKLGAARVFMDVESIGPGQRFAEAIDQTIDKSGTVIAVIGPLWLTALKERESAPAEDFVRHELTSALSRRKRIIPVLVGGATAAVLRQLDGDLSDLASIEAVTLHDESFNDDCARLAKSLGGGRRILWQAVAAALALAAVILLFSTNGFKSIEEGRAKRAQVATLLSTARTQTKLNEFEAAYKTSLNAVKLTPGNNSALDMEVTCAMLWLEHYGVLEHEGEKAADIAAPQLAELMAVLDAGAARANGKDARSADILAHLGWAHWLNQSIAEKEFGYTPQVFFKRALAIEPTNVYASAMLGNWLLQTKGDFRTAIQSFSVALGTGKVRSFVRELQLGGMVYNDAPGVPEEAVRALNDMRKNSEVLADDDKQRFLSFDFDFGPEASQLNRVLRAVAPDDLLLTYQWLEDARRNDDEDELREFRRGLIKAAVLGLKGRQMDAKEAFAAAKIRARAWHMNENVVESVEHAAL